VATFPHERILELRFGNRPECLGYRAGSQDQPVITAGLASFPHVEPIESISGLGVPMVWTVAPTESENKRKAALLLCVELLLKKLPREHVDPLKKGGVRFFKGDPAIGGYYRVGTSFVHLNVAVRPDFLPWALLHEIGHVVHFEVADNRSMQKFIGLNWIQLGRLRWRKLWHGRHGFLTRYSATSAEEDFAESYAGFAATLFSKEEWIRANPFGELLPCPACGAQWFTKNPKNDNEGICAACDTLYKRNGASWSPQRRNIVGAGTLKSGPLIADPFRGLLVCPGCGKRRFMLDRNNEDEGTCVSCNTLYRRRGAEWLIKSRTAIKPETLQKIQTLEQYCLRIATRKGSA
jgi:hypothetical protein